MINNYSINRNSVAFTFFSLVFLSLSIFFGRFANIPVAYFPIYVYVIYYFFCNFKFFKKIDKISYVFFVFISLYFIYSLSITRDIYSTILYYIMWLMNIFTMMVFVKHENIKYFCNTYINIILISLLLGFLFLILLLSDSANPYLMWNKNSYLFFIFCGFVYSFYYKRKKVAILIFTLSLFIFARTLLVMYLAFFVLYYFSFKRFKYLVVIISSIFLLVGGLFVFEPHRMEFLFERIEDAKSLGNALYDYFFVSHNLSIGQVVGDHQRFMLFIANIDILVSTFPKGTGLGLANYLSYIDPSYYKFFVNGHAARAHNFYISYSAEMGVFFIGLIFLFIKIFKDIDDRILKCGMISIFVGLTFNEYITNPYVWMFFGLCLSLKINYKNNKL